MIKKISLLVLILTLTAGLFEASAQKRPKPGRTGAIGKVRAVVKKVEVEDWKEFESKELNLKIILPKPPTVSVNTNTFEGNGVKSFVIQSYINTDYYMVEVREYPAGIIPNRTDMGENYGAWLKRFILSRVTVISEKTFDYNQYRMVEFVYQQIGSEILIHRAMVVGDRLYQFIVQFEVKKPETVEQTIQKNKGKLDKFFLSFEITGEEFVS